MTSDRVGGRRKNIFTRNPRAFTLMELVVVMALVSIMLVVAIPRLGPGLFSDGGDDTARWIIATVQGLKTRSVMDQRTCFLHVSLDDQTMWISVDASSASETETEVPERLYPLPDGVSIEQVDFSSTHFVSAGTVAVAFYPKGYSDKAVIRIQNRNGERMSFFIEPFLSHIRMVRSGNG